MDNEESDDASNAESDADEPEENMADQLDNLGWCQCELCSIMPTVKECLCCNEDAANVVNKLYEENMECVSEHVDFPVICLNKVVLEMLMYCLSWAQLRFINPII